MEDALEVLDNVEFPRKTSYVKRPLKDRTNPLSSYDDSEFYIRFRLKKDGFQYIFSLVEHQLNNSQGRGRFPSVPPILQFSVTLRYYATAGFQSATGDLFGLHQSTVSRVVRKTSQAIASLSPTIIKIPSNEESLTTNLYFLNYSNFPGVTGIVDGTHVWIQSPGGESAELYRNRKGWFSLNVQVVCNEKHKFINVVARWPGSVHDSRIWQNSRIRRDLEEGKLQGVILGDSAYPLSKQLLVPFDYPCSSGKHGRFNRALCRCRVFIEQTIGNWKRRFPVLAFKIRKSPEDAAVIVVATAVLHNLCVDLNQPIPGDSHIETEQDVNSLYDDDPFVPDEDFVFSGDEIRDAIVERF